MLSGIALDAVLTRVGDSGTQKAPRCCWPGPGRREILADQAVAPLFAALSLRIWLAAFLPHSRQRLSRQAVLTTSFN
jgi:hypothetical protein